MSDWHYYQGGRQMPFDVVAYMYKADIYLPSQIADVLCVDGGPYDGWKLADGTAPQSVESNLTEIATACGIDRMDEATFDSDEFPKVVFRDQITSEELEELESRS